MIFSFLLCGFLIAKFWQDTIILSINHLAQYTKLTQAVIKQSLFLSPVGLTIGSMIVGPLNDRFGPKKTFPVYLGIISILNIMFLYPCNATIFKIALFLRSLCLAGAINNVYVGISLMFKGDALPKATSILYMSLFGFGTIFPIAFLFFVKALSFKSLVLLNLILCLVVSVFLYIKLPEKNPIFINLKTFKTWLDFIVNPKFLACSAVSMVCIGGFYGILSLYKSEFATLPEETLKVETTITIYITLGIIQAIGRGMTFLTATFCSFQLNTSNVNRYLAISNFMLFIGFLSMFISGLVLNKLILVGSFG
ncbi:MAG: MFS transporter, partial [Romboutsia sp.]|nr:MFS transporter [Romboutsia sp.]